MSNGEKRDAMIAPIKCDDDEKWRLETAADLDRLPMATWLRNLGLARADTLPSDPRRERSPRSASDVGHMLVTTHYDKAPVSAVQPVLVGIYTGLDDNTPVQLASFTFANTEAFFKAWVP